MTFPEPLWRDSMDFPAFKALEEDVQVEAVIVGGGMAGITTAYLLAKEGVKVALLEADTLLNGTTGHTTAKITAQHDLIYDELIQHFGATKARQHYDANMAAKQFIEHTVQEQQIDCDLLKQDAYLYATTEQSARKLEMEYKAYEQLGIAGELIDSIPFDLKIYNALKMRNQAQFHPLKYLKHLVQQMVEAGGLIFENTAAVNVKEDGKQIAVLTRNGPKATGSHVIACSHFPFYEGTGLYSARMHADRSYVLACKTKKPYPGGMYLSVDQPSRSLRSVRHGDDTLVLIGGDSHKAGQGENTVTHYQALEDFGQEVLGLANIIFRWSTQDLVTLDKLPYIGPITSSQPRILIATGFRKWGMTNSTAAAQLLKDLVLGKNNPYADLYTPLRFTPDPSLKNLIKENANVVKHLIKGKLEISQITPKDLAKDQGAVITLHGERKGAYRDQEGHLHIVDTTCTHVGCEVNWNAGDRTWDCPCHGSRFSYTGDVIEGPAEKPLQRKHYDMLDNLTSPDSGY